MAPAEEEALVLGDPEKWSSIECMMWLKHHGFKEFTDIFYSNGFEGWHLVNLTYDSFAGVKTLTPARINALLAAIEELKQVGSWTVPTEKEAPPAHVPAQPTQPTIPEEVSAPPPSIAAVGRLNSTGSAGSHGSGPRSGSFSQQRTPSSLNPRSGSMSGFALPDTPDVELARMQYFLTQEITREDSIVLLHNGNGPDGEYLIRSSRRKKG